MQGLHLHFAGAQGLASHSAEATAIASKFAEATAIDLQFAGAPEIFGAFHITAALIAAAAAVILACRFSVCSEKIRIRILAASGWLLLLMEIYKQLFLYFAVNRGVYDWWFFPFQLCSVPMYLCIALPYMRGKLRNASLTFMATFTFLSSVAALVFPEDFLRPQISLTLHGFIWHGMLLFISLLIILSGMADLSRRGFLRAVALFLLLCCMAVCINVAAEPIMNSASGIRHDYAAMFYLNPYHISPQPVVSTVQQKSGIAAGLVLYVLSIIAAGGVLCRLFSAIPPRSDC